MSAAAGKVVIRSNARGTVNRRVIQKLVLDLQVEARIHYHYDEMGGIDFSKDGSWLPARLPANTHPQEGICMLDPQDFEGGASARFYINDAGKLLMRVHQNLVYELRVRPAPKPLTPYTPHERKVLRKLYDLVPLNLAYDWMVVVGLIEMHLVESRKTPGGQLEILGLTDAGKKAVESF